MEQSHISSLRNLITQTETLKESIDAGLTNAEIHGQLKVLHSLTLQHPDMLDWAQDYARENNLIDNHENQ